MIGVITGSRKGPNAGGPKGSPNGPSKIVP